MANTEAQEKNPTAIAVEEKAIAFKPKNWEELWKFASLICKTEFVPPQFRDQPGACLAAIQTGHELGLPPMASLQSIAVINGRPTVWGDGALALVKAHPLCEWVHELPAQEAEKNGYGECSIKRRGDPEPITRRFSIEMAQKAGLIQRSGEKGVWATYRGRMLQMRARAWAMRDAIPEALKGVAIREEVEDYEAEVVPEVERGHLPEPEKPKIERLKDKLKAETAQPEQQPLAEPQAEESEEPIEHEGLVRLIEEIERLENVMQLAEFRFQINKKLKAAGVKTETEIARVSEALNKKKNELEAVT